MNRPKPSAHAAATLMITPISVSVFGWMRSLTHALMIARSGNMHDGADQPGEGRAAEAARRSAVRARQRCRRLRGL